MLGRSGTIFSCAVVAIAACGGGRGRTAPAPTAPARPITAAERILALLPAGAQIVVEVDLARLRANPAIGEVVTHALGELGGDTRLPGLPVVVPGSPLAAADALVLAAYGVGTAQAATLSILATHAEVEGSTRIGPDLVALGPDEWLGQLEARAAIAARQPLVAPKELLALRDHAMPAGAPGAAVRITARLPFDARVALARQTGLDTPPAQLSLWADVADDLAIVIDADAADPGDKAGKDATRRLAATIQTLLAAAADEPTVRALGLPTSLTGARLVQQGSWIRTIIAVGPRHLARAAERARAMLAPAP